MDWNTAAKQKYTAAMCDICDQMALGCQEVCHHRTEHCLVLDYALPKLLAVERALRKEWPE